MAEKHRPFRPADRRARVAIMLFWAYIAVSALVVLALIGAAGSGVNLYAEEPEAIDESPLSVAVLLAAGLIFIAYVAILLGCIVTYLLWLYRARANLASLGIADARWSPGWAIAWWFIPIMSLFRPYQLVKEVWQASHPAATPADWRRRAVPGFFGWWWALFLVGEIGGNLTDRISRAAPPDMSTATALTMIDVMVFAISGGAAWFAIRIMREITHGQTARRQLAAFA